MKFAPLTLILSAALAAHAVGVSAQSSEQRSLAIDTAKSRAQFSVQHIFVEHVTGIVPIVKGSVELPVGSVIPTRATAFLDATRFDAGDPDRNESLKSSNYFDTAKFPTWTFISTKIAPTSPSTFEADGLLTMHGVTRPEHLDVKVGGNAVHPIYHAVAHIDRHAFGMKGTRFDPTIGGIADVTLDIVLKY